MISFLLLFCIIQSCFGYTVYTFYNDTKCEEKLETKLFWKMKNDDYAKIDWDKDGQDTIQGGECYWDVLDNEESRWRCGDGVVETTQGNSCQGPFVTNVDPATVVACSTECTRWEGNPNIWLFYKCNCGAKKSMDGMMTAAIVLTFLPCCWIGCCCIMWLIFVIFCCVYGPNC